MFPWELSKHIFINIKLINYLVPIILHSETHHNFTTGNFSWYTKKYTNGFTIWFSTASQSESLQLHNLNPYSFTIWFLKAYSFSTLGDTHYTYMTFVIKPKMHTLYFTSTLILVPSPIIFTFLTPTLTF